MEGNQLSRQVFSVRSEVLADFDDPKPGYFGDLKEAREKHGLNNGNRTYTVAFIYPGNCQYCISIGSIVFKNFICSSTGNDMDWCVLDCTGLEKKFAFFDCIQILHVVSRSDEEVGRIELKPEQI